VIHQVLDWVNTGQIGEVRLVQANRCVRGEFTPESRVMKRELGGGSLLGFHQ